MAVGMVVQHEIPLKGLLLSLDWAIWFGIKAISVYELSAFLLLDEYKNQTEHTSSAIVIKQW